MPKKTPTADDDTTPAAGLFGSQPSQPALPPLPESYEAGVQELESLIARIESGQLPLDQLLAGYRRGAQLLAFCRSRLEAVEEQIRVLDGGELTPWSGTRDGAP